MPIYRYTYLTRINKSKSARTDENLYYLFHKIKASHLSVV